MIKHFMVYESRQIIRQNVTSICSDSLGSIHTGCFEKVGCVIRS